MTKSLLTWKNDDEFEKNYRIPEGVSVIGRFDEDSVADIQIGTEYGYKTISRFHCRIYNENGNLEIEDSDSINGTYINRIKINPGKKVPLRNGDELRLGELELEVIIK